MDMSGRDPAATTNDDRKPFRPFRKRRETPRPIPIRPSTRKGLTDIAGVGSLADLERLKHARRDRWAWDTFDDDDD